MTNENRWFMVRAWQAEEEARKTATKPIPMFQVGQRVQVIDTNSADTAGEWIVTETRWQAELLTYDYFLHRPDNPNEWTVWGVLNLRGLLPVLPDADTSS